MGACPFSATRGGGGPYTAARVRNWFEDIEVGAHHVGKGPSSRVGACFPTMDKVRFSAPTFLGDTIHLELEITRSRETSDGGIVVVDQKSQEPGRRRRLLGNSQAADGKPARRGDWLTS